MIMRALCALAGGLLLASSAAAAQAVDSPAEAPPPGWRLDWSDEFDGATLDTRTWVAETGGNGWGNNELQYYTARPKNLRVSDGFLVIEAHRERYENRDYTSARIKTAGLKERTYGRYEARIKIPQGQGIWPAFWMLGADIAQFDP